MAEVEEALIRDAHALAEGGVDGLMLENFGDAPFFPGPVPSVTVAALTSLARAVRDRISLPLGINVLRNDAVAALGIAAAVGAAFIRVNVLTGARVTDQGVIEGCAHRLLRERASLRAEDVRIFADVDVKHSAALAPRPHEEEVHDLIGRGGADVVIVSGARTGAAVPLADLHAARRAAGEHPIFVGSGVTSATIADLLPLADGFIVGSTFKEGDVTTAPVDPKRVESFMQHVRTLRANLRRDGM